MNDKIKNSRDKIQPSEEARARMLKNILAHNKAKKFNTWKAVVPIAACFAIVALIAFPALHREEITLMRSTEGIRVSITQNAPTPSTSTQLAFQTEKELFNNWDTSIFDGTIREITNIELDFGGRYKDYRAIAKIEVNEMLRGDLAVGSEIEVLLPAPVGENVWVEDTDITSQFKVGMTGIFMPRKLTETDYHEENGKKLYLLDLAQYSFMDGVRYAFIETDKGLQFGRWAYPSIANAVTLDEVKEFIEKAVDNEEVAQIDIDKKIANISDNYGGIYTENGKTIVLVVDLAHTDTTELCKQLGINKSTATFKEAKYSFKYLTELQAKISRKMADKTFSFVISSALMDNENIIRVTVLSTASAEQITDLKSLDTKGGAIEIEYSNGSMPQKE